MSLQIVTAPARAGCQWVTLSLQAFWRNPWSMTALAFLATACMVPTFFIPFIGEALNLALSLFFTLAIMVVVAETSQGSRSGLLLRAVRAIRERRSAMLTLALLYITCFFTLVGMTALVDGGSFARSTLDIETLSPEIAKDIKYLLAKLLYSILLVPLTILFWHAPGLIHWHEMSPIKAMFFSAAAFLRNWRAHLVFLLSWLGIGLLYLLLAGIVTLLVNKAGAIVILTVTAIPMLIALYISVFFSFRDSFSSPVTPTVQPVNAAQA